MLSHVLWLQPKGQAPSRPDLMTLAAQRIQQPLPGLLGRGPSLAGPSFAPPQYGAIPGQVPIPLPQPDYPPYPSTSYGYPLQQGFEGYGQSLNPNYGQSAGSPSANQHIPFGLTSSALADISGFASTGCLPLQQPQSASLYGQHLDAFNTSQLRPIFPPNQMLVPSQYQQKLMGAHDFTQSTDASFSYSQPYTSMPAGASFYS